MNVKLRIGRTFPGKHTETDYCGNISTTSNVLRLGQSIVNVEEEWLRTCNITREERGKVTSSADRIGGDVGSEGVVELFHLLL